MRLIQVARKNNTSMIKLSGSAIERAGFTLDDIFAIEYEYGNIKLQKFDPQKFGF
jgi:hypothetical protein